MSPNFPGVTNDTLKYDISTQTTLSFDQISNWTITPLNQTGGTAGSSLKGFAPLTLTVNLDLEGAVTPLETLKANLKKKKWENYSKTTPWDDDGFAWPIDLLDPNKEYENAKNWRNLLRAAWPELGKWEEESPTVAAADYYLLSAIRHDLFPEAGGDKVQVEVAEKTFDALCDKWDGIFLNYLAMTVGGEIRHHIAYGNRIVPLDRWKAWIVWRQYWDQYGVDCLEHIGKMFAEFGKVTSVCGVRWQEATEVLRSRIEGKLGPNEKVNKRLFVDRVFTLEHNGGCFINKLDWKDGVDTIKWVFNAHSSNPPNISVLYHHASQSTKLIWQSYWGDAPNNPASQALVYPWDEAPNNPHEDDYEHDEDYCDCDECCPQDYDEDYR